MCLDGGCEKSLRLHKKQRDWSLGLSFCFLSKLMIRTRQRGFELLLERVAASLCVRKIPPAPLDDRNRKANFEIKRPAFTRAFLLRKLQTAAAACFGSIHGLG